MFFTARCRVTLNCGETLQTGTVAIFKGQQMKEIKTPAQAAFVVGVCFAFVLFVPVAMIWKGHVITIVWGWFLVPLGIPQIGIAHAIGLGVLSMFFNGSSSLSKNDIRELLGKEKDIEERLLEAAFRMASYPAIFLGIAYVAKGFM